jgi:hypothetical protein
MIFCTIDAGILASQPILELLWSHSCHLITTNFCSNVIMSLFFFCTHSIFIWRNPFVRFVKDTS